VIIESSELCSESLQLLNGVVAVLLALIRFIMTDVEQSCEVCLPGWLLSLFSYIIIYGEAVINVHDVLPVTTLAVNK